MESEGREVKVVTSIHKDGKTPVLVTIEPGKDGLGGTIVDVKKLPKKGDKQKKTK